MLVCITALFGLALLQGSDRLPPDATQPLFVRDSDRIGRPACGSLCLGTFNIHGGRGLSGHVNLDATAEILRATDLDLVGLNEVHSSFTLDQAKSLGDRLAMASTFVGTERRWWREHIGNGVLTRRPVSDFTRIELPGTQGKGFRNALLMTVELDGREVRVVSAHVDPGVDQQQQLTILFDLFRSLEPPAVLIGDLNCTIDEPQIAALLSDPSVVDALALRPDFGYLRDRVDHILVRGLVVEDADLVHTDVSDHPHAWARLALP